MLAQGPMTTPPGEFCPAPAPLAPLTWILFVVALGAVVGAEKATAELFVAPVRVRPERMSVWLPVLAWLVVSVRFNWPPVRATEPMVSA